MEIKKILNDVVNIHNQISSINVHGDDVLIMANAIQELRNLVFYLNDLGEDKETPTEE